MSTVTFHEASHVYRVDGNKVPGVTSITGVLDKSGPLMWWAVNEARDYIKDEMEPGETVDRVRIDEVAEGARLAHKQSSTRAANIGTRAHEWIEGYINSLLEGWDEPDLPENEEIRNAVDEFLEWEEQHDVEYIATEEIVYNADHNYAGTFDLLARIDGHLDVIDFKTSKNVYPDMHMQLAAYWYAVEWDQEYDDPDGYRILHLPKTRAEFSDIPVRDEREIQSHFDGFLGARRLYEWEVSHND